GLAAATTDDRRRDDQQTEQGRRDDAHGHPGLSGKKAEGDQGGEERAEDRLGEEQGREQPELPMAGQVTAGVRAGWIEEGSREKDPVEGFVAIEQAVLERPLEDQRQYGEEESQTELDLRRDPHRTDIGVTPFDVLGDAAGEQLVDRPVKGG